MFLSATSLPFIVVDAAKSFAMSFIDDFSETCISFTTSITPLGSQEILVASTLFEGYQPFLLKELHHHQHGFYS